MNKNTKSNQHRVGNKIVKLFFPIF